MAKYKTALGRTIDLDRLIAKNERTRAVGNMKVNARGDSIDGFGKIVEPITNKVNKNYSKTVGSKSSRPVKQSAPQRNINQRPTPAAKPNIKQELTSHERELEQEMQDDIEVENIRANERKNNGR